MFGRLFVKGSCPVASWSAALASFVAVVLLGSLQAHAQVYWSNTASGDWSNVDNWSGDLVPTITSNAWIVNGGTAAVTTMNATCGTLSLGSNAGSGAVQMTGGSLSVRGYEYVGNAGTGSFTQSGGTNSVVYEFDLGFGRGASGCYNLGGNGLMSAVFEYVGNAGTGSFTQSGGTNSVSVSGVFCVGNLASSSGTYSLSGTGRLSLSSEGVGNYGTGLFTQSGGTNSALAQPRLLFRRQLVRIVSMEAVGCPRPA